MDILYILIPLSVGLALVILAALGWAVWRGQFEGIDAEGERILRSD
jgi:cbb3-type cytochrome oxidase maturation protein